MLTIIENNSYNKNMILLIDNYLEKKHPDNILIIEILSKRDVMCNNALVNYLCIRLCLIVILFPVFIVYDDTFNYVCNYMCNLR